MLKPRSYSLSLFTLIVIVVILLAVAPWSGFHIIAWDTFGYYLYLPELFIYHDPGVRNYEQVMEIIRQYKISTTFYQVHDHPNGNHIIQYPIGMALFYLPAFLAGHCIALFSSFPADGFSAPYEWSMFIVHFIYVIIGLVLFRKLMLHFFSEKITAVLLLLIVFGTNYFFLEQTIASPHTYLFMLQCFFILQVIKWHEKPDIRSSFLLGATLAFMTLCRATELLLIFVPLLWNVTSFSDLKQKLRDLFTQHRELLLISIVAFLLVVSPQLIFWKVFTGDFLYYSYRNAGEGFDFLTPHTFKFLFSFRKGWFIYTPLMLLTCIGFYYLKKYNPKIFLAILIFFIVNVYILSSWSCWYYAGGFSQRALIQSYGVLAIALGYFIVEMSRKKAIVKWSIALFCLLCVVLNLFQSWQMFNQILHPSRTTKPYYFAVFGKTAVPEGAEKLLLMQRSIDGVDIFDSTAYRLHQDIKIDFEEDNPFIRNRICDTLGYRSSHALMINDSFPFSDNVVTPFNDITNHTDHAWIQIKLKYYYTGDVLEVKPTPCVAFENRKGEGYDFRGFDLEKAEFNAKPGVWNELETAYLTPEVRSAKDKFMLFFWLRGKGSFFVDDIEIKTFVKKE